MDDGGKHVIETLGGCKITAAVKDGIVTLTDKTGGVPKVSILTTTLADGVSAKVNFNPAADKLRILSSDGTVLRLTIDTGKVVTEGQQRLCMRHYPEHHRGGPYEILYLYRKTQLFKIDGAARELVLAGNRRMTAN